MTVTSDGSAADERLRQGRAMQDHLDPGLADALHNALADVAPDFARLTTEVAFGDVYGRPGLDLRSRQIATIASLVTLGERSQLQTHLRFALNIGMPREELVEVIVQMAVYAGWPRSLNALYAARDPVRLDRCGRRAADFGSVIAA